MPVYLQLTKISLVDETIPVFREFPHPCPYIPERQCSNLRFSLTYAENSFLDMLLSRGFRHFGEQYFRPACAGCNACVGIRIPVATFKPDRSQRRCLKDNTDLQWEMGDVVESAERLDLLNRFQVARWISKGWGLMEYTAEQYDSSFAWDPAVTHEICVRDRSGRLLAVGILDITEHSASAIYHYHAPEESHRGLGTWMILKELELLRDMGISYLYLGLWNGDCPSLQYKKRFRPFELFIDEKWVREDLGSSISAPIESPFGF